MTTVLLYLLNCIGLNGNCALAFFNRLAVLVIWCSSSMYQLQNPLLIVALCLKSNLHNQNLNIVPKRGNRRQRWREVPLQIWVGDYILTQDMGNPIPKSEKFCSNICNNENSTDVGLMLRKKILICVMNSDELDKYISEIFENYTKLANPIPKS